MGLLSVLHTFYARPHTAYSVNNSGWGYSGWLDAKTEIPLEIPWWDGGHRQQADPWNKWLRWNIFSCFWYRNNLNILNGLEFWALWIFSVYLVSSKWTLKSFIMWDLRCGCDRLWRFDDLNFYFNLKIFKC